MKVKVSFIVTIDDCHYIALPRFSPKLLSELEDDVALAVCEHEKLEGCKVEAIAKYEKEPR